MLPVAETPRTFEVIGPNDKGARNDGLRDSPDNIGSMVMSRSGNMAAESEPLIGLDTLSSDQWEAARYSQRLYEIIRTYIYDCVKCNRILGASRYLGGLSRKRARLSI